MSLKRLTNDIRHHLSDSQFLNEGVSLYNFRYE